MRAPVRQDLYDYVRAELGKLADLSKVERIVLLNHDAGKLLPIRTWPAPRFAEVARVDIATGGRSPPCPKQVAVTCFRKKS